MGLFNYRDLLLELNINGKTIDDNGDPVEDNKKPAKTDNDNEEYTEPEDEEPTDYTKETGDDDNEDDDNNDTDNTDNGSDSSSEVDNKNTSELQSAENKLFADLSPEQMAIKNRELKQKFIDIYKTTSYILYKFTSVPKSSFNNKSIVFVVNKLNKLRDIVFDYISETFFTKTYIENSIMLQEFIVTLNTINNIISELQIEFKDENKKSKK